MALDVRTSELCAVKIVPKKLFYENKKVKELFHTECKVLKKINNPNVVRYIDDFETINHAYLVLEFCNEGDLEEYIEKKNNRRINEDEAIEYF